MNAGQAVDNLSPQFENRPVVFLEDYYYAPKGDRISRFWAAHGGGSVYFPLIIVDSGNQFSTGSLNYTAVYGGMVETAMARPPLASLRVTKERIGDVLSFDVEVTNLSGSTLSTSNSATVHAIVFEDGEPEVPTIGRVTDRYVRAANDVPLAPDLANGATATFSVDVSLAGIGVDWANVHAVVLVDYRPGGSTGPYDMLQAFFSP